MLRVAICDDNESCFLNLKSMLGHWSGASSYPLEIDCFDNGDSLIRKS